MCSPQEKGTLLGFLVDGADVEGYCKVLHDVNTKEPGALVYLH